MQKTISMLVLAFCLSTSLSITTYANNVPKFKNLLKKSKQKSDTAALSKKSLGKNTIDVAAIQNKALKEISENQNTAKVSKQDELIVKMSLEAYEKFEAAKEDYRNYTKNNSSHLQIKFANLMDVDAKELNNIPLLEKMDYWFGTPYRYGGTSKSGIDCSAFTRTIVDEVFKVKLPRTAREQYAALEKISRSELEEGDLIFFNTTGGISHVGIYLGNNKFIHSSRSKGVTIADLGSNYWSARYVGAGKVF